MKRQLWLEEIIRESGIRKAMLIYGNVYDNCRDGNRYRPFMEVLWNELKRKKFSPCVSWDRITGLSFPDKEQKECYQKLIENNLQKETQVKGEDYELDIDEDEPEEGNKKETQECSPGDFFQVVDKLMNMENSCPAIVIDFSDYLFGNSNALSEQERLWLTQLAKTSCQNLPRLTTKNVALPSGIIILITTKLGAIPPAFYQNESVAKICHVPLPDRQERELYWNSHREILSVKNKNENGIKKLAESTEDLSYRDMYQIIKLSRQANEQISEDKLINLYRFGELKSPWEDLDREKLKNVGNILKQRVIGQEEAVGRISTMIIRAYVGLAGIQHSGKRCKPKGNLFFVGPTGVGKTELAKATAEFLFGDEAACIRFDMSEFNHEHSDQRLVGAPPGYVGFEEGGQLTNAVKEKPFCVLLFDEIEKAHPRVLDKFLQILEDGRLTDGKGQTVYFSESVIIFTSNLGASEIKLDEDFKVQKEKFISVVRKHFNDELKRPELLNRFGDNIIPFRFIQDEKLRQKIVESKLNPLFCFIQEKYNVTLRFKEPEESYKYIVNTAETGHGGRGLINVLERHLIDPLSLFLFSELDKLAPGRVVRIELIRIKDKYQGFDFELTNE